MRKGVTYDEGDIFAIPLPHVGGYGVGLVARSRGTGVVLGYFFGARFATVPALDEVGTVSPDVAVWVERFGDLGLLRGDWPMVGRLDGWNRRDWPMPQFSRVERLADGHRYWRVEYSDDDPGNRLRETEISREEAQQLPHDGLAGFGFVEAVLADRVRDQLQ